MSIAIKPRSLAIGIATLVPGLRAFTGRKTGGTVSARYCYSVWLRHLFMLHKNGMRTNFEAVVELGPGDSLGTGLAALLCGADRYTALDAVRYAGSARNLEILEDLVTLFRSRAAIPDESEFPLIQPPLPSYAFPDFLNPALLDTALSSARLDSIRVAVANPATTPRHDRRIEYHAPW